MLAPRVGMGAGHCPATAENGGRMEHCFPYAAGDGPEERGVSVDG
jgi:hypothetical protein